ncbi:hypothetical protein BKN37_08845 [Mycobacterium talmoniae]|uniref:Uncharacterized protein n=1 Tax=Mycobacterium talmoniae TaxID=1858794 RepID=A0A1S1NJP9_9MYCO|nr:hypothetical protein BKN37_08845 [Mycobacterium talmoniae]
MDQMVHSLARVAPAGWTRLHGAFSMAGGEEVAQVVAETPRGDVAVPVESSIIAPIRTHRRVTVGPQGPWLRLLFDCDNSGTLRVGFDYGDTELPADQLLSSDAYLQDFEQYPRPDAPLWLLAYMGNEGQQLRSAATARSNTAVGAGDVRIADDEIPPLPQLWARIAVLAAVCRGGNLQLGPRCDPAFQFHAGDNGGCALARLPDNRAVLSGGRHDSRLLSAAYKGAIAWPDLYRGAPSWVHNLYLDPRAGQGLLSFCYWWDGDHWYRAELAEAAALKRGDSPWRPEEEITPSVPGVWTEDSTADLVAEVLKRLGIELTDRNARSAFRLIRAAEAGIVSDTHLSRMFIDGIPQTFDVAEALAQLDAAGALLPPYPPIDQTTALKLVVDYCRSREISTHGYPLDQLVATRIPGGWQVFVPVPADEVAVDRMVFLVADDRVVEQASSINPDDLQYTFASRFARRVRGQEQ